MISRAATLPPHLSGTSVSAAADSELSAPERARVLSHLSRCAACRGRLVTEMATKDLVHSLGLGAPTPPTDLNRTLLSMGEAPAQSCPVRSLVLARRPGRGPRPSAVGVLSAVGLSVGLAAAVVVPTGTAAPPAPTRSATVAVVGRPADPAVGSATGDPAVVLPAAFVTGGGPVAPVRGTAPGAHASSAPVIRRAALLVVVDVVLARLETLAGH